MSSTTYTHDSLGRVATSEQTTAGTSYKFVYGYYADGSLAWTRFNENSPVKKTRTNCYDRHGRQIWVSSLLTAADCSNGTVATAQNSYAVAGYAAHGSIEQITFGNGLNERWCFSSLLEVTGMRFGAGTSSNCMYQSGDILGLEWEYASAIQPAHNGNVMAQVIRMRRSMAAPTEVRVRQTYGYDMVNRLTSASEAVEAGSGNGWSTTWQYDHRGNMAATHVSGPTLQWGTPTNLGQYSQPTNRLIYNTEAAMAGGTQDIHYDPDGTQTSRPSISGGNDSFSYNAEGLLAVSGPIQYQYDAEGRRVRKTAAQGGTTYVYDAAGELAAEYGASVGPEGIKYVTSDSLGSTRAVTDASGQVLSRSDYEPFGSELPVAADSARSGVEGFSQDGGVQLKFTGKERDAESGLDYFGARYFSGAQGRFTSPDPLGAAAGKEGDPQSWNLYAYARNNPLLYVDPDGLKYRICDTSGNCDDHYSDADFDKNLSKNAKKGVLYDKDGNKIGTYQRTSFDDLSPFGNMFFKEMSARRQASNQFIGAFAVASVVAGTGVGIGLQATGGASLTTLESAAPYFRYTPGQLNQLIGGAQRELLKDFFGQGQQGAASRLANFKLPGGLTRETLEIYKEAALRVVQRGPGAPGYEVQKLRLEIVEKALSLLKK